MSHCHLLAARKRFLAHQAEQSRELQPDPAAIAATASQQQHQELSSSQQRQQADACQAPGVGDQVAGRQQHQQQAAINQHHQQQQQGKQHLMHLVIRVNQPKATRVIPAVEEQQQHKQQQHAAHGVAHHQHGDAQPLVTNQLLPDQHDPSNQHVNQHPSQLAAAQHHHQQQQHQQHAQDADDGHYTDMDCPICRTRMTGQIQVFPCGHFFCDDCSTQTLATAAPACPYCRCKVTAGQVFRVVLAVAGGGGGCSHDPEVDPPEGQELRTVKVCGSCKPPSVHIVSCSAVIKENFNTLGVSLPSACRHPVSGQSNHPVHSCVVLCALRLFSPDNSAVHSHHHLRTNQVVGQWMTKLEGLLRRLLWLSRHAPAEKSLVFSQWPEALALAGKALDVAGLRHVSLTGGRSAVRKAIKSFAEDDNVRVFLLSMRSGAAGLTLTRANHVFLLEPALDPAIEQQAVARVHRIGQGRPVTITRLLVDGSVEMKVSRGESDGGTTGGWNQSHSMPCYVHVMQRSNKPVSFEPHGSYFNPAGNVLPFCRRCYKWHTPSSGC